MPSNLGSELIVFLTAFTVGVVPTLFFDSPEHNQSRIVSTQPTRGSSPSLKRSNCVTEKLFDDDRDPVSNAAALIREHASLTDKRSAIARKHAKQPTPTTQAELLEIDMRLLEMELAYRRIRDAFLNDNRDGLLHREICIEP